MIEHLKKYEYLHGDIANFLYLCQTDSNNSFMKIESIAYKDTLLYINNGPNLVGKILGPILEDSSQSIEEMSQSIEEESQNEDNISLIKEDLSPIKEETSQSKDEESLMQVKKEQSEPIDKKMEDKVEINSDLCKDKEADFINITESDTSEKKQKETKQRKTRKRTRKQYEDDKQSKEKQNTKESTQFQTLHKKKRKKGSSTNKTQIKKRVSKNIQKLNDLDKGKFDQITIKDSINKSKKDKEEKKKRRPNTHSKEMELYRKITSLIVANKSLGDTTECIQVFK
jgi:hypothetical protein